MIVAMAQHTRLCQRFRLDIAFASFIQSTSYFTHPSSHIYTRNIIYWYICSGIYCFTHECPHHRHQVHSFETESTAGTFKSLVSNPEMRRTVKMLRCVFRTPHSDHSLHSHQHHCFSLSSRAVCLTWKRRCSPNWKWVLLNHLHY